MYESGLTLLEIKSTLNDSKNLLSNWVASDESPCNWTGISCYPQDQRVRSMYVLPIFFISILLDSIFNLLLKLIHYYYWGFLQ